MSWFDATGFANLAKSALKEAQKTIDKALDIKDEEQKSVETPKEDTSDFFAAWGLKNEDIHNINKNRNMKQEGASSIWGSFTGSFFETPKFNEGDNRARRISHCRSLQSTPTDNEKKLLSSSSFSEDYKDAVSNKWRIAKQTEDVEAVEDTASTVSKEPDPPDKADEIKTSQENDAVVTISAESSTNTQEILTANISGSLMQEEEKGYNNDSDSAASTSNRLSYLSPENDKKSLESVEVLGSQSNTDCTTTPESESNSVGSNLTSSSAVGTKANSESIEVLPDSLVTSPSSVEVLGEWKSDISPYLSPSNPRCIESSSFLDGNDSVTPCWDDTNVLPITDIELVTDRSCSDISPYESPLDESNTPHENSCTSSVNSTPSTGTYPHFCRSFSGGHTVNLLQKSYTEEPEEGSLAEDSYTSASDTTVMTMLGTFQTKEQGTVDMDASTDNLINEKTQNFGVEDKAIAKKANTDTQFNANLDIQLEKHNLYLPIEAITTQPIRKTEYFSGAGIQPDVNQSSFDRLMNTTIEPAEPEHFPYEDCEHQYKIEGTDVSDQYLMSVNSSCEGTLIGSSTEDNQQSIQKSEEKDGPINCSSYVATMLEDAMIEKDDEIIVEAEIHNVDIPRENSPMSSESRSDVIKIGSDQTSGHTSGDELETTTSSDIEIISRYSPNGDSSSTQSRQSVAKLQLSKGGDLLWRTLKTKGHSRELSEISVGSDDANVEIEKLLKRIQEMTEILEARESKLIDVSRMNMELHEQNSNLQKQLDNFEQHVEQKQNLNQITDEYTQRLSALEKKFQQAIRERDSLRKSLDKLKAENAMRMSSQELSSLNAEKDEIIKELREEGEKLSKQQLQHSNIIKKLRAKEKENDSLIKSQKEQIEEQTSELERLKRSLRAKEEVELSQIDAVYSLTAKTKTLEKEMLALQKQLDSVTSNADTYKKNLDATKAELTETKEILAATEAELKEAVNNAGESCQMAAQIEELKIKLRESEESHVKKEDFLKHENSELLKRLESAETRSEELSESVSMATKPLLRQLEQLQGNLLHKTNSFMKQEKILTERNTELQTKMENLQQSNRYLKEENVNLKSTLCQLEAKLTAKENEKTQLRKLHDELIAEKEKLTEQNERHRQTIETLEQSHSSQVMELNREIVALENKLAVEKAATDAERRKNNAISEQQQQQQLIGSIERLTPTTSIEEDPANTLDTVWPLYKSATENSVDRYSMPFDNIRTGTSSTSLFENLQAQLKQKDGEIQQLQWELSRRNIERDALNSELSSLTLKIEELNANVKDVVVLKENLQEIQTRYDALLQMYGEKMEENEELRLDLQDVKEMYKTQIDQLLKRDI